MLGAPKVSHHSCSHVQFRQQNTNFERVMIPVTVEFAGARTTWCVTPATNPGFYSARMSDAEELVAGVYKPNDALMFTPQCTP